MKEEKNAVRPDSLTPSKYLARLLNYLRKLIGGDRFENLLTSVANEIEKIEGLKGQKIIMLDYGCGMMEFSKRLSDNKVIEQFVGADIFPSPNSQSNSHSKKWDKYVQIAKGSTENIVGNFDLAIVTDVLHHASPQDQENILMGLSKISRYILIKDHLEYGFFSRQLLRLADWYGNYAYGVDIPERYFTKESWQTLIGEIGLKEIQLKNSIKVHGGIFGIIIPPHYHFISIIEC